MPTRKCADKSRHGQLPYRGKQIALAAFLALLFLTDPFSRPFICNLQTPFLNHFFDIIKYAGNCFVGLGLSCALIIIGKYVRKPRWLKTGKLMAYSLIVSGLFVLAAKPVLDIHPRNDFEPHYHPDTRWGRFPSGDAAVVFSIAASLSAEFPELMLPSYFVGGVVGVERVYFNLHFFSDIFAGAWLAVGVVNYLDRKYF